MCVGVGVFGCGCPGEVSERDMFSTVIICIMDFNFFLSMTVYYYQFKCF